MPQFRILVDTVDPLFQEYKILGILDNAIVKDTPWGTKEFAFFDPNSVGLTFFETTELCKSEEHPRIRTGNKI